MIELCTIPKELFKPFIGTICDFKPEVELNMCPESKNITLCTIDTEKVAFLAMELAIEPKELTSIQLSLKSLEKVSPKKDDVKIYHNGNVVTIVVDGMKFNIKTLDPRTSGLRTPPVPNVEYKTSVSLTGEDLENINSLFKIVSNYTDSAVFQVIEGKLSITANLTSEDTVEKTIDTTVDGPDCRTRFPAMYLRETFDNYKLYESAILSMGTNIPLKLAFTSEKMNSSIMIAPRVEDNDL